MTIPNSADDVDLSCSAPPRCRQLPPSSLLRILGRCRCWGKARAVLAGSGTAAGPSSRRAAAAARGRLLVLMVVYGSILFCLYDEADESVDITCMAGPTFTTNFRAHRNVPSAKGRGGRKYNAPISTDWICARGQNAVGSMRWLESERPQGTSMVLQIRVP